MRTALRTKTIVQPGGVIEIQSPDLIPGSIAEVVVRLEIQANKSSEIRKQPDPALSLGWPPGFFERTFGSLRDSPFMREDQGKYETRDGIE